MTSIDRRATAAERRAAIVELLADGGPIPGDEVARRFGVSRQAIVHDVAILRAEGAPIVATVRGYLLAPSAGASPRAVVAVRHGPEQSELELMTLIDLGVRVLDVVVEHAVYGELRGELHLGSRTDVEDWLAATRESGVHLLSELTGGVHLHTLEADRADRLELARTALARRGFLLE